jgi:hypothetical protein
MKIKIDPLNPPTPKKQLAAVRELWKQKICPERDCEVLAKHGIAADFRLEGEDGYESRMRRLAGRRKA